jgi:hypothetical protein
MNVTETGQSVYVDGREPIRYGRDISAGTSHAVWYHCGLHKYDEPSWAMDKDVAQKLSVSVDTLLVPTQDGLYAVERRPFLQSTEDIDGDEQHVARASDGFVHYVGDDPKDHMSIALSVESGNQVYDDYHKQRNES